MTGMCGLCGRNVGEENLTEHHLLPRSQARRMKRRKKARLELKQRNPERTIPLCRPCHRNVHASIDNKDLERDYGSIELLKKHPDIRKFTEWIRNRPNGTHAS